MCFTNNNNNKKIQQQSHYKGDLQKLYLNSIKPCRMTNKCSKRIVNVIFYLCFDFVFWVNKRKIMFSMNSVTEIPWYNSRVRLGNNRKNWRKTLEFNKVCCVYVLKVKVLIVVIRLCYRVIQQWHQLKPEKG